MVALSLSSMGKWERQSEREWLDCRSVEFDWQTGFGEILAEWILIVLDPCYLLWTFFVSIKI